MNYFHQCTRGLIVAGLHNGCPLIAAIDSKRGQAERENSRRDQIEDNRFANLLLWFRWRSRRDRCSEGLAHSSQLLLVLLPHGFASEVAGWIFAVVPAARLSDGLRITWSVVDNPLQTSR